VVAAQGKPVRVGYLATANGAATLEVRKGNKRIARVVATAKGGRNTITWNGKHAAAGKYTLIITVTSGDSQTATDKALLTTRKRNR
jgi:hypothetical protein